MLGVYCGGVFLYSHVMANFVYIRGQFIVSMFLVSVIGPINIIIIIRAFL